MDTKKLLRKIRRGSQSALGEIIRAYSAYVVTVIENRGRGFLTPEDAEEVAADVFYALWQHADQVENLKSWLSGVARNKAIDRLRQQKIALPLEERTAVSPGDELWEAAAAAVAILCGTAFAAVENGWFGFDRLFGESTEMVEDYVVTYTPEMETSETIVSEGVITEDMLSTVDEETMRQIAAGEIEVQPNQSYGAECEDYHFSLDSMLAGKNVIYSVIKMEPLTEYGRAHLELTHEDGFFPYARNSTGINESALNSRFLSSDGTAAYYLLITYEGENHVGDTVEYWIHQEDRFEVDFKAEITELMEDEKVIQMDTSVYEGTHQYFDTMTVTPMSLQLSGWYDWQHRDETMLLPEENGGVYWEEGPEDPKVSMTLKDGTSFRLANMLENAYAPYGTYGAAYASMYGDSNGSSDLVYTWVFSQVIELEEIEKITVDGVDYPME